MFPQTSVGSRHLLTSGKGYSPVSGAEGMSDDDMNRLPGAFCSLTTPGRYVRVASTGGGTC